MKCSKWEAMGDHRYGNLTNNIAGITYSRNVSIARVLCFDNLLRTIQITCCFPIIKSIPCSFKWTCSWSFKSELFSELPQFGRKLIRCIFIYCACWIRRLNGRQSFQSQSEILRRTNSIKKFLKPKRCIPTIWNMTERNASRDMDLNNERTFCT